MTEKLNRFADLRDQAAVQVLHDQNGEENECPT